MEKSLILIAGADSQSLRLAAVKKDSNLIEEHVDLPAKSRNERELISTFLDRRQLVWTDFTKVIQLVGPTGKTSNRVLETILKTSCWYYQIDFRKLNVSAISEPLAALDL